MEATNPTAGWEKVGDQFYRKTQLYTAVFDQDLDLDNYIVAGAPYGGAVGETCLNLLMLKPFDWVFLFCFIFSNSHYLANLAQRFAGTRLAL